MRQVALTSMLLAFGIGFVFALAGALLYYFKIHKKKESDSLVLIASAFLMLLGVGALGWAVINLVVWLMAPAVMTPANV